MPMVYIFTPSSLATSEAVIGATTPVLLLPSVSNMMLLLFAFPSLRRLSDVAMPSPMAVPSSRTFIVRDCRYCSNCALSTVIGTPVRLSPAKITIPILSLSRPAINWAATFFAASKRSGSKSRASIDDDTSIAITMSVPSVEVVRQLSRNCGLAITMMRQARVASRSTKRRWRRYCFQVRGSFAKGEVVDSDSVAWRRRCLSTYHTTNGTRTRSVHKKLG